MINFQPVLKIVQDWEWLESLNHKYISQNKQQFFASLFQVKCRQQVFCRSKLVNSEIILSPKTTMKYKNHNMLECLEIQRLVLSCRNYYGSRGMIFVVVSSFSLQIISLHIFAKNISSWEILLSTRMVKNIARACVLALPFCSERKCPLFLISNWQS